MIEELGYDAIIYDLANYNPMVAEEIKEKASLTEVMKGYLVKLFTKRGTNG